MRFGSDFFKWFEFVIAIIRMAVKVFGDKEDVEADDEMKEKHGHYADKLVG